MPGRFEARWRKQGKRDRRRTLADSALRTSSVRAGMAEALAGPTQDAQSARGAFTPPGRLTLPSMPIATPDQSWEDEGLPGGYDGEWSTGQADGDDDGWDAEYGAAPADGFGEWGDEYETPTGRERSHSLARPLPPKPSKLPKPSKPPKPPKRARTFSHPLAPALPEYNHREASDPKLALYPALPQESAPDLVAYRPPRARMRRATERLMQSARDPWTRARLILALVAAVFAFFYVPLHMGEPSQPLQVAQAQMGLSPGASITSQVRPETQLKRPDLYDSYAQFQEWGGAACSAAAMSEVLTAYGVRGATIGHEIDEFGSSISPNWGLLNRHAFAIVAARHGLRADESNSWTYNQMIYVSEHLGIPVIVNVRIAYGYYSFFSGGHFLVVVGGDSQGLAIVDSSEYYIHYLPKAVFYQMFTGYTVAIVPGDDHYTLPAN